MAHGNVTNQNNLELELHAIHIFHVLVETSRSSNTDSKEGNRFKAARFKQRGKKIESKHKNNLQKGSSKPKARWHEFTKQNQGSKTICLCNELHHSPTVGQ